MIKISCDGCGKELSNDELASYTERRMRVSIFNLNEAKEMVGWDSCYDCYGKVFGMFNKDAGHAPVPGQNE